MARGATCQHIDLAQRALVLVPLGAEAIVVVEYHRLVHTGLARCLRREAVGLLLLLLLPALQLNVLGNPRVEWHHDALEGVPHDERAPVWIELAPQLLNGRALPFG